LNPFVTEGLGDLSTYAALAKAPEKARTKHNPFENDPTAIAAGKNLFQQHCSECHGNSGDGSKKAPSLRVEQVQNTSPGAIFWLITNGVVRRGMPVWSKLRAPTLAARDLPEVARPIFTHPTTHA